MESPLEEFARAVSNAIEASAQASQKSTEAVAKIAESTTRAQTDLRLALALFGAAVALQPAVDAKRLLADFDRQLELNSPQEGNVPMAALDLRTVLAQVVEGLGQGRD
jgi:hypothetical protein